MAYDKELVDGYHAACIECDLLLNCEYFTTA